MNRESRKSDYTTLLVERLDNGVLVVTLNRPDEGNAMNTQMCIDLLDRNESPVTTPPDSPGPLPGSSGAPFTLVGSVLCNRGAKNKTVFLLLFIEQLQTKHRLTVLAMIV